jgi:hypothetical protein
LVGAVDASAGLAAAFAPPGLDFAFLPAIGYDDETTGGVLLEDPKEGG